MKTVSPESECTDPKNVIADNESTIHKGSYDTKRYSQLGSLFEIFGFKVGEFCSSFSSISRLIRNVARPAMSQMKAYDAGINKKKRPYLKKSH